MAKNKKILITPIILAVLIFGFLFVNFGAGCAVAYETMRVDATVSVFDLAFGVGGVRVFGGVTFTVVMYFILLIYAFVNVLLTYKGNKHFGSNVGLGAFSLVMGILYFCIPCFVLAQQTEPLPAGYSLVGSGATICLGIFLILFAITCAVECYIIKRLEQGKTIIPDKLVSPTTPVQVSSSTKDDVDEVKKKILEYKKMLDDGLIDEEEYKKLKEKLIEKA